jgi:hypothetical protein
MPATAATSTARVATVQAGNLRKRVPLAVIGVNGADLPAPIFGAAYVREEGVVTVALSNGNHLELRKKDTVTVTYDPENLAGVKGLRRCTGHGWHAAHLRRIGTDPSATAYCDQNVKAHKAAKRADPTHGANWQADRKAAKQAKMNERITYVMEGTAAGRAALAAEASRKKAVNHYAAMYETKTA